MRDDPSQAGEISVVRKLIAPDWPRYLVDVGANDGQTISNTYTFARDGWTSLLLEPQPNVFARLQKTHAGRANVTCLELAAGKEAGTAKLFMDETDPTGLGATINAEESAEMVKRRENTRTIDIRIETLTRLLQQHNFPTDFSLLSIDAEGCDLDVLQGMDFAQFRPRLIITEEFRVHAERERMKLELLKANGYVLYQPIGCNELWVRPEFLPNQA